jgi:hypothetical protein
MQFGNFPRCRTNPFVWFFIHKTLSTTHAAARILSPAAARILSCGSLYIQLSLNCIEYPALPDLPPRTIARHEKYHDFAFFFRKRPKRNKSLPTFSVNVFRTCCRTTKYVTNLKQTPIADLRKVAMFNN